MKIIILIEKIENHTSEDNSLKTNANVKEDDSDLDTNFDDDQVDVQGFLFSTLIYKRKQLKDKLKRFERALLLNASEEVDELHEWEYAPLGMQLASYIYSKNEGTGGSGLKALRAFVDMSQNILIRTYKLLSIRVDDEQEKMIKTVFKDMIALEDTQLWPKLQKMPYRSSGMLMLLNGALVSEDLNLFSIIKHIRNDIWFYLKYKTQYEW